MNHFATLASAAMLAAVTTAPVQAEAVNYTLDPSHTFATFEVVHFGTSTIRARFNKKTGKVMLDRAAKTGRVEVDIDMASIDSGVPQFDKHLSGADFFDIAKHPSARFVSDRVDFNGDKVASVSGALTMMGKTHPVTLKTTNFNCYMSPILKREVCGGDFEATIQRSLWGVSYGLPQVTGDNVKLLIQAEAVKQ